MFPNRILIGYLPGWQISSWAPSGMNLVFVFQQRCAKTKSVRMIEKHEFKERGRLKLWC